MYWTELTFGEHTGHTLPWVAFHDPDWFFWAYEKGSVFRGKLRQEADFVHRRATRIKIRTSSTEPSEVEHLIDPTTGAYSTFRVVPVSQPLHKGHSKAFRSTVIDLSTPRRFKSYDKLGSRNMLSAAKHHLFDNASARMTEKRSQEFFEDDSRFDL